MTVAAIAVSAVLFTACEKPPVAQAAPATPVFTPAKPDGKEFKIDVAASKVEWIGTKVTGKHNGTINLKSGSVFVKDGAVVAGKFVADMASLDDKDLSGEYHDKLNKHLKSDEFFDVEKFPEGVFEISSVETSPNGATVKGNLTLKGVTHGVTFDANIVVEKNTFVANGSGSSSASRSEINIDDVGGGANAQITQNLFSVGNTLINDCYDGSGKGFAISGNFVQGSVPSGAKGNCVSGVTSGDPAFVNAAAGDYHPGNAQAQPFGAYAP